MFSLILGVGGGLYIPVSFEYAATHTSKAGSFDVASHLLERIWWLVEVYVENIEI